MHELEVKFLHFPRCPVRRQVNLPVKSVKWVWFVHMLLAPDQNPSLVSLSLHLRDNWSRNPPVFSLLPDIWKKRKECINKCGKECLKSTNVEMCATSLCNLLVSGYIFTVFSDWMFFTHVSLCPSILSTNMHHEMWENITRPQLLVAGVTSESSQSTSRSTWRSCGCFFCRKKEKETQIQSQTMKMLCTRLIITFNSFSILSISAPIMSTMFSPCFNIRFSNSSIVVICLTSWRREKDWNQKVFMVTTDFIPVTGSPGQWCPDSDEWGVVRRCQLQPCI